MFQNSNKIIIIFCLFSISLISNAQIQPYIAKPTNANLNSNSVKKIIVLIRKDVCRNIINDTLDIYFYNLKGQKNKSLNYLKNKLNYYTNSFFDKNNNVIKYDSYYTDYTKRNSIITFEYTDNKEIKSGNYDLNEKKDTIFKNIETKKYNKKGDLIESTTSLGLIKTYFYNNKKQKIIDVTQSKNTALIEKTFYFYKDDLLIKQENYSINKKTPSDSLLNSYHNYNYNTQKQLIEERYTSSVSIEEQINKYEYNSENQLVKMSLNKGLNFKNVEYEYNKGKLNKQKVNTNRMYGFGEEFNIPLIYCYIPKGKEFNYEADFFYDNKNNLIRIDHYIDNNLKKSIEYIFEYY